VYIFKFPFSRETLSLAISADRPGQCLIYLVWMKISNYMNFYLETFQLLTKQNAG